MPSSHTHASGTALGHGANPGSGVTSKPPGNFAQALLNTAAAAEARPAIVEATATTSYGELVERSLGIATNLRELELQPGDRVAMLLRRGADAAAAFFGVLSAGGVAVIVNETLRPRQIEHILNHSGATVLLTSAAITDRLPRAIETSARIVEAAAIPPERGGALTPRLAADVAQIVYTSGSTGAPKGVTLSHGNLWAGMQAVVSYLGITEDDRLASFLPFSFDYGFNQLLCGVGTGATLVVDSSPVPGRLVQTLSSENVTVLAAVPPLWLQLLEVESFRAEPLPSLRLMTNTGGRLPREAVRQLRASHPETDLVLMYGLTEAFRSTYLAPNKVDVKPDSIGSAIPGAEILVLADDLTPCGPGETGELVHRGPTVALGYWNDEASTAAVYRSNPVRAPGTPDVERVVFSGDIVRRDEEGDLFFVGRRDAMIKTLGYRVSPDEVADVLYASGEVVEAVVTAEADEVRGEGIVAYVVLAEHGDLTRLESFAAQELPRYMQPSRIETRESLDRTSSGKFDPKATARAHDPD